jgi:hypothetical protein
MLNRLARLSLLIIAPLMLFGCVLTPGTFVSTMSINADRTFNFTYKGEVIALDLGKEFGKGLGGSESKGEIDPDDMPSADAKLLLEDDGKAEVGMADISTKDSKDADIKNVAIAAALSKEYGYRSARYLGKGKFEIDYAVTGTLTHNFTFPFNVDAEAVFPFVVIELRQGNLIRVKAPGFANDTSKSDKAMSGMGSPTASALNGIFTLDTDAEIVSQNNEDGATKIGARKSIRWKATPLTKDAPTAVLRLAR